MTKIILQKYTLISDYANFISIYNEQWTISLEFGVSCGTSTSSVTAKSPGA